MADFVSGLTSPGTAFLVAHHGMACDPCRLKFARLHAPCAHPDATPVLKRLSLRTRRVAISRVVGVAAVGEAVYEIRGGAGVRLTSRAPLRLAELVITRGALLIGDERYASGDFVVLDAASPACLRATILGGFALYATAHDDDERARRIRPERRRTLVFRDRDA